MIKRKRINVRFGDIHLQLNIELLFAVVYPVTGGVSGYCSRNPESLILNFPESQFFNSCRYQVLYSNSMKHHPKLKPLSRYNVR